MPAFAHPTCCLGKLLIPFQHLQGEDDNGNGSDCCESLSSHRLQSPAQQLCTLSKEVRQLKRRAMLSGTRTETDLLELISSGVGIDDELSKEFFNDIQAAKVWNQYRRVRICLNETLLAVANDLIEQHCWDLSLTAMRQLGDVFTHARDVIQSMVSGICNTVDYHMHRIDSEGQACSDKSQRLLGGKTVLSPLEVVLRCQESTSEDKAQAGSALEEIRHGLGILQALNVLEEGAGQGDHRTA